MIKTCQTCKLTFPVQAGEDWKPYCKRCYAKMKQAETKAESSKPSQQPEVRIVTVQMTIPDEMLMRLIRLCHPDRHNNSEASTIETKWLIAVRDEQRRAA